MKLFHIIRLLIFWKDSTIENLLRVVKNAESEEQFKKIQIKKKISTSDLKNLCQENSRYLDLESNGGKIIASLNLPQTQALEILRLLEGKS